MHISNFIQITHTLCLVWRWWSSGQGLRGRKDAPVRSRGTGGMKCGAGEEQGRGFLPGAAFFRSGGRWCRPSHMEGDTGEIFWRTTSRAESEEHGWCQGGQGVAPERSSQRRWTSTAATLFLAAANGLVWGRLETARVGETTEQIFSWPSVGPTHLGSGRANLLGQQI